MKGMTMSGQKPSPERETLSPALRDDIAQCIGRVLMLATHQLAVGNFGEALQCFAERIALLAKAEGRQEERALIHADIASGAYATVQRFIDKDKQE